MQLGISRDQWRSACPQLSAENELVYQVWRFCSGWNPAVLPLAVAYYGVEDADHLVAQLLAMREAIDRHKAASQGKR